MAFTQSVYVLVAAAILQAVIVLGSNCNNDNLGIIGGHTVTVQDAPFFVELYRYVKESSTYDAFCGGSIIHERYILTAGHCLFMVNFFFDDPKKRVLVGSDRLDHGGKFIDVEKEFRHENFIVNINTLENDIALLRLKEPVPFGCKVAKIELPYEELELKEGTLVNVTGFGRTGSERGLVNELRQTTIPILSDECCHELYNVNDTQLCAGTRRLGSFKGDSGGPLTYQGIQVGVVSYGEPTVETYQAQVYVKVKSYLDWINNIIEENE